jgi:hypothetical protein
VTLSVLMAVYNFDNMDKLIVPVYPKPLDARLPPATKFSPAVFAAEVKDVENVPTDSSGVIFHSEVRNTDIDSSGRLTLTKKPEQPGLYQVSVMLSMPNNASVVPLDIIIRVTETGGANQYMPELGFQPAGIMTYPMSNTVYEGFEFSMTLGGSDQQTRVTQPPGCTDVRTGCRILSDTQVRACVSSMYLFICKSCA